MISLLCVHKTNASLNVKAQSLFIENSKEYYQIDVPKDKLFIVRLHGVYSNK